MGKVGEEGWHEGRGDLVGEFGRLAELKKALFVFPNEVLENVVGRREDVFFFFFFQ